MKEAFILDFKVLNDQNLSLLEFLTLLKLTYPEMEYEINDDVLNSLQEKQFIKIVKDEEQSITILREKSKLLIDFLLIEGLNSDYKVNKVNKKSERVINNGIDDFVNEFRGMWKGLKPGSMGSFAGCKEKLIRWMKDNPQYSKEDVLKAARIYIKSLDNYTYLQQADYFIYKKDAFGESSRLSAFVDEQETSNVSWTNTLS
ncbi:MAG TPA: hypothetical protein VF680_17095 [Allosphingosinicella sp.]|jgi:hypothetical protein